MVSFRCACRPTPRGRAEIICHHGAAGPVTVGEFLDRASALAARLPETGHAVNLCADRYHALLGFVAAVLRGPRQGRVALPVAGVDIGAGGEPARHPG